MWYLLGLSIVGFIVAGILWMKARPLIAKSILIPFVLMFVGFLWLSRPWWHWLWFRVFYMNPTFWIFTVAIGVILGLIYWLRRNVRKPRVVKPRWREEEYLTTERRVWHYLGTGLGLWIALIIFYSVWCGPFTATGPLNMCKIYQELEPMTITLDTLPETIGVRYMPLEVAEYYGKSKLGRPEIKYGNFDPIIYEGELVWVSPREQDGPIRRLKYQTNGVSIIRSDGSVKTFLPPEAIKDGEINYDLGMKSGEGMYIFDHLIWKLRERKYFVDYCEVFYLFENDIPLTVVPYMGFKYRFPVMVPYWAGVCVVRPDGTIEDYTPEEAQALSFTQGHRLFPEKLGRIYIESFAYKKGWVNKWFIHREQIEIPTVRYSTNQMPYLLPGPEGPQWMVAAEAAGETFGLYQIFYIDAHQGVSPASLIKIFEIPVDPETGEREMWIGPNRAWEFAKGISEVKDLKWYEVEEGEEKAGVGTWRLLEPRPAIDSQGRLYWMESVTTREFAGVKYTLFVNAKAPEKERYAFEKREEVEAFLKIGVKPSEEITLPPEKISPEVISQLEKMNQMYQEFQEKWQEEWEKLMEMLKSE